MSEQKTVFSVEYEFPQQTVVFYNEVIADSMAEAKMKIQAQYPDAVIRAVSIVSSTPDSNKETAIETL